MLKKTWIPVFPALGAALLLASCAAGDPTVEDTEEEPASSAGESEEVAAAAGDADLAAPAAAPDPEDAQANYPGGQQLIIGTDGVEFFYISAEEDEGDEVFHLYCQDDEALAAKAAHNDGAEPAGWPQDWDGTEAMPDPLCHPDYLQIDEWEDLEAHSACWEGTETSTLVRTGQSQEEVDEQLWLQSQARADWEQNPAGGSCAEQWAANED